MKVFLDIDGVMVHANPYKTVELEDDGFYRFAFRAVSAFNCIENPDIILSTSHRHRFSIPVWENIFMKRGIHFKSISIITNECSHKISRREEIETWVREKKYRNDDFIIIDDDKSLNGLPKRLKERVVMTSPYVGLYDSKEIDKILHKKKKRV